MPELKPWGETTFVGKPTPRVDARERLTGAAVYTLDMVLPDMLYGATLRSPHANAMVKKVDLAKAREMPGVRGILSDADPEANIPWYQSQGRQPSRLFDPHCRYEGDEIAVVAAETQQQAWDAVRAIQVEYEKLPFVTSMEDSLKNGAPAIFENGNRVSQQPSRMNRGDVDKGFAEADVVLEETYRTSIEIHTPLETHGSVARWEGDHLTVWDSTQGVFAVHSSLAASLNMPLSKVRVIGPYMGGGFGAKLGISKCTVMAALLARKTRRPVKLFVTREESFLAVGNRPAHRMTVKAGVKKNGALTALQLTGMAECGAYPGNSSAGYLFQGLYECPHVRIQEETALVNAGPSRAFRAPGFPQGAWALEQMMDALAEKIGMDPVEFRLKNIATVCHPEQNRPYTSIGLSQCLSEGAETFGWTAARARGKGSGDIVRGVGVASGMWGSQGYQPSTAIVKVFADGSVNLNMGAADIGTGTKTVMSQVVAEELGVPLAKISVEHADTGTTQYSGPSGGSKTVLIDSPAVRAAAADVKAKLIEMAAAQLKVSAESLTIKDGVISAPGGSPSVAFNRLQALSQQNVAIGVGVRGPNPPDKSIRPFSTHFAEVEVNKRTGEVRVVRLLAAQDSGRVMNPITYRNQVLGGLTMGIGFALTEERLLDPQTGKMVNATWHDYKIPTAKDFPLDFTCLPIDPHDTECNTTGAKGLGEPATIPTAAAIANAFYNATGVRITTAPITRAKVISLLSQGKARG